VGPPPPACRRSYSGFRTRVAFYLTCGSTVIQCEVRGGCCAESVVSMTVSPFKVLPRPSCLPTEPVYWTSWSGRVFDLLRPDPKLIQLSDIAHHLARVCRWGGGTPGHYSVAEHSLRVGWVAPKKFARAARVHDGHEFVLHDVSEPLRRLLSPVYPWLVQQWDFAICEALDVDYDELTSDEVCEADETVRLAEESFILGRQAPALIDETSWSLASCRWGFHRSGFLERFSIAHVEAVFLQQLIDDVVDAAEEKAVSVCGR